MFTCILLSRLLTLEDFQPEVCRFCANWEATNMILWRKQEKCIEQNMLFYILFVNLTKTFNTEEALWNILQWLVCANHISAMYTGMKASVSLRELLEVFEVGNVVKQGYVLSHTVLDFSFYGLVWCPQWFFQGLWIQSRLGAKLFNASQFKFVGKTQNVLVCKFMFADNTAFVAYNHQDVQEIKYLLLKICKGILDKNQTPENQDYVSITIKISWLAKTCR